MAFLQQESEFQYQNFNSVIGNGPLSNYKVGSSFSSSQGLVRLLKGQNFSSNSDGTSWQHGQVLDPNSYSTHMPCIGKMQTEGLETLVPHSEGDFKGNLTKGDNSRSCSPPNDGEMNENSLKGIKVDTKICGVCGDKALGNNFNAITCESCKAFFRRNALKHKDFVCPFNDNCKVDPVTRRFCQKCRLKKCMDIGMKKEWIMTDEEKKVKRQKIEQNRLKRQSSDAPPSGNDGPLAKNCCILREDQESNSSSNCQLPPNEDHHDDELDKNNIVRINLEDKKRLNCIKSHHAEDSQQHSIIQHIPKDAISYDNSSNSSEACGLSSQQMHPLGISQMESESSAHLTYHRSNGHDLLDPTVVGITSHEGGRGHKLRHHVNVMPYNSHILNGNSSEKMHLGSSSLKSRMYGVSHHVQPNFHPHTTGSSEQNHTPLLSSLIRPGLAESPPDADLVDCSSSNIVINNHHNVNESVQNYAAMHNNSSYDHERNPTASHNHSHPELPTFNGHSKGSNRGEEEAIPLPLNTMDSILSVAITAEYNSFGMLGRNDGSQSRELNKAERAKLNELRIASQALHAPVDAEGPFKLTETSDPSLINVINLTDIAIRRLIQMSKKISSFKNMCQEDQIALLKGSCTEMMILRSAVSYDPDRDSWNIPHSFGYNIKLGVLKEARGNLYEEHQRFVRSFKSVWRSDENIMIILCAITLFTPERPNVVHKDVVKLEQDSYYYLLKRYLESTLNGCEARSTYLQLIRKIAELHELNSNHLRVFLEVNPREVEPLLIEIFDLKQ